MVTLFHWDMPSTLSREGGWMNESIIDRFRDFAELCYEQFGDRVSIIWQQ